jgi:thiol-activated cytolysin
MTMENENMDVKKYDAGVITLHHKGAYIAKFTISWDETIDGQTKRVQWEKNGKHQTAGYYEEIALSASCDNFYIKAEVETGLAWSKWHVIFERKELPFVPKRKIVIGGTTLHTNYTIDPDELKK